ncbi:MAG: hypothetical protein J1F28_08710 [Oscillospiraceae bacterium]|nr:hypothetical protein [Oscillospiraceae bacterium]
MAELTKGYNKYLNKMNSSSLKEISKLKNELNGVNEKIESTVELLITVKSKALKEKLSELEKQRNRIDKRIMELSADKSLLSVSERELKSVCSMVRRTLAQGTLSNIKQLIELYVDSVTVYPDKVIVTFNFFPAINLERKEAVNFNNGECADLAHSPLLPSDELCRYLVYELSRTDVYDFKVGNRLYLRLRTDRSEAP